MSKQTARQLTRQERRREEQQRREEERRHAARRKRITIFSIIGVVALAVAGLVYLVVAQSQTPANAAYPVVDNISCQSTEQGGTHIHAHVTMYVNGTKTALPANIGIAPDNSCLYFSCRLLRVGLNTQRNLFSFWTEIWCFSSARPSWYPKCLAGAGHRRYDIHRNDHRCKSAQQRDFRNCRRRRGYGYDP